MHWAADSALSNGAAAIRAREERASLTAGVERFSDQAATTGVAPVSVMASNLDVEEEHRLRWVKVRQWQSTLEIPLRLLSVRSIAKYQLFACVVILFIGIEPLEDFDTVRETTQCASAENGICEDGLAGSVSYLCSNGADCVDCSSDATGVRVTYGALFNFYLLRGGPLSTNSTPGGTQEVNAFTPSLHPFPSHLPSIRPPEDSTHRKRMP